MDGGHRILAVYTQPDRPAGRGRRLQPGPVKRFALDRGLPVRQPRTLAGEAGELAALGPELMVVVAYGLLLPAEILALPRLGCINVHASLLPRWRGAAPIQRAIEAGDALTGVTIMQMDASLDTGPILLQKETPLGPEDTAASVHHRLAELGARALAEALPLLEQGRLVPQPQDETRASYAPKLRKEEALLDWSQPAVVLERKVRAFNPWPVAATYYKDRLLRIWSAGVGPAPARAAAPGTVAALEQGVGVQTGDGLLWLRRLQLQGGRPMDWRDFLNGHPLALGDRLGTPPATG